MAIIYPVLEENDIYTIDEEEVLNFKNKDSNELLKECELVISFSFEDNDYEKKKTIFKMLQNFSNLIPTIKNKELEHHDNIYRVTVYDFISLIEEKIAEILSIIKKLKGQIQKNYQIENQINEYVTFNGNTQKINSDLRFIKNTFLEFVTQDEFKNIDDCISKLDELKNKLLLSSKLKLYKKKINEKILQLQQQIEKYRIDYEFLKNIGLQLIDLKCGGTDLIQQLIYSDIE